MRRSPNIIYVGDTVTLDDGNAWRVSDVKLREHVEFDREPDRWTIRNWEDLVALMAANSSMRTASPVQGHRSGRGDAAREGDGT